MTVKKNTNLIRLPEVKSKLGLGKSTIYKKVKEGTFPAPVKIGARASGWLEHEVDQWIDDQAAQRIGAEF